jgi:hypothetical protein
MKYNPEPKGIYIPNVILYIAFRYAGENMVKLQQIVIKTPKGTETQRYFITLPRAMVERKGWKKGQELALTWNEHGHIEIHE